MTTTTTAWRVPERMDADKVMASVHSAYGDAGLPTMPPCPPIAGGRHLHAVPGTGTPDASLTVPAQEVVDRLVAATARCPRGWRLDQAAALASVEGGLRSGWITGHRKASGDLILDRADADEWVRDMVQARTIEVTA